MTTGGEINETEAVQHRTLSSFFFLKAFYYWCIYLLSSLNSNNKCHVAGDLVSPTRRAIAGPQASGPV